MSSSLPGVDDTFSEFVVKMEPIEIDDTMSGKSPVSSSSSLPNPDEFVLDYHGSSLPKSRRRWRLRMALIVGVFLTIAVIIPSAIFGGKRRSTSRKARVSTLTSYLERAGVSTEDAMKLTDTPQYKATQWLAKEDPANLPVPNDDTPEHEKYRYLVRYVMAVIYYSMGGEKWTRSQANFMTGEDVCFWHHPTLFAGLYCTKFTLDPHRTPILLYLNTMKVSGSIPSELGQLSLLRTVSLQSNKIIGAIPTEICEMNSLEALALNSNELTGIIPPCLDQNTKLKEIYLTYNNLRGKIPKQICNLSNLQVLSMGFNKLGGTVPNCMQDLPRLKQMRVQQNGLTGSLPSSLCNIESLDLLSLGWNDLTGTIPTCFGKMSALKKLFLHTNKFKGTIPYEICDTPRLNVLDAGFNVLTGTIPACLGDKDIQLLSLGENALTGTIPSELAHATNLNVLLLDDNLLTGDPTTTLTKLTKLKQLYVNGNNFQGEIDDSFLVNSTLLDFADFSDNKFTSPDGIPQHLLQLRTLNVLDLSKNLLAGKLPEDMRSSGVLNVLSLYNNQLTGTIPKSIRRMANLLHLDLSNNGFTGELPSDIGEMNMLEVLFLSKNNFDAGTIPSSFSGLQRLKELSLRSTNRTGALPGFISNFPKLDVLDLGSNGLTGSIPSGYGNLDTLTYLLLNDNDIDGTVPDTLGQLTDLRAAYLDGTSLSGDLDAVCAIPFFADNTQSPDERLIADCVDGTVKKEISCDCCLCCKAGTPGGCSEPKLMNLDVMWENSFRRQDHVLDFGGEDETIDVKPSIDVQSE